MKIYGIEERRELDDTLLCPQSLYSGARSSSRQACRDQSLFVELGKIPKEEDQGRYTG